MKVEIEEKKKIEIACERYKRIHKSGFKKFEKLDEWLNKESLLFENEITKIKKTYHKFKRGQIIKVDFGINVGSELSYTHFAIVLNKKDNINNENLVVIPITSKNGNNRINLGNLLLKAYPNTKKYNLNCYANITQITSISKERILQDKGKYICSNDVLNELDNSLKTLYINC